MHTRMRSLFNVAAISLAALASQFVTVSDATGAGQTAARHLQPFASDEELITYLKAAKTTSRFSSWSSDGGDDLLSEVSVTGARVASPSITNTQHAGVDEGGIVKVHGDHLVMLRRGRLFSVDISYGRLRPISTVNAFGPDMNPDGAWYDELLVSKNRVVVIGYSYELRGTELGLFDIDAAGKLTYRATYHLFSDDYYSGRNYASRLIGDTLIFYAPLGLPRVYDGKIEGLPGLRKWRKEAEDEDDESVDDFTDITSARQIYRIPAAPAKDQMLHTVTTCDLAAAELQCKATGLLGSWSRVFYVSPSAVYVWTGGWGGELREPGRLYSLQAPGTLFRMPLDGSSPQAIGVYSSPVDQLSFEETPEGYLDVVVRSDAAGDWMVAAEFAGGDTALLHLPIASFGDGTLAAPMSAYRPLPSPPEGVFQNRFVQGKLLYGSGEGWWEGETGDSKLYVVDPETGAIAGIALPHGVDRIEAMGDAAVVVGERGKDLHFSGIRLAERPRRAQQYVLKNAAQGEMRTHGFFYKPGRHGTGVLGLPVRRPIEEGYEHLFSESASIVFLRNAEGAFERIGELQSNTRTAVDDHCEASCIDWYGNSRPIFVNGRILALMGYEIVEGRIGGDGLKEIRRATFAPRQEMARAE